MDYQHLIAQVMSTTKPHPGVVSFVAPDTGVIRDSRGRDGGLICQAPSSPLIRARYRSAISNGASGPGNRPVIADRDVVATTGLAIEACCPGNLPAHLRQVDTLKLGDTTRK
jgi:hypothetical protein